MRLEVRLFAAARDAVGASERTVELPPGASAADALETLDPSGSAAGVLAQCSLLLDGEAVLDLAAPLPDAVRMDVLPPFAGG